MKNYGSDLARFQNLIYNERVIRYKSYANIMKKQQEQNTNYKTISKNESYLLERIRSEGLLTFNVDEVEALTNWDKTRIHNTFSTLLKKGHIIRIKRGIYTLEENFFDKTFEVITDTVKPSYISFWTALSFYGFTEQQVNAIQLVSTKQYSDFKVEGRGIQISTFKPRRFYGYVNREGMIIAEKEKSLIDSLFMLDKCGGFEEYIKCIKNAYGELDKNKFKDYLFKFNNKSIVSRIGYILERLDLAEESMLNELKSKKSKSYVLLDPKGDRIKEHNSLWNIKVNKALGGRKR